jgi:hypothetical protein
VEVGVGVGVGVGVAAIGAAALPDEPLSAAALLHAPSKQINISGTARMPVRKSINTYLRPRNAQPTYSLRCS